LALLLQPSGEQPGGFTDARFSGLLEQGQRSVLLAAAEGGEGLGVDRVLGVNEVSDIGDSLTFAGILIHAAAGGGELLAGLITGCGGDVAVFN
jgi:hypothetical protein